MPPVRAFPLEFCNSCWLKKTRMVPLPEMSKSVHLDTVPALDGQTNGQTELVKQYCALHALHADVL